MKIINKLKKFIYDNKEAVLLTIFITSLTVFGLLPTILTTIIISSIYYYMNRGDKVKKVKKEKKEKVIKKKSLLKKIVLGFLGLAIVGLVSIIAFALLIIFTAPEFNPNNLARSESTTLYDKDGQVITKLGLEKRELITYDQMPDVLVDAIIATEDSRFFQHNGFDLPRFLKASFGQVLGQDVGGASTLTMQVSKNNYTSTVASGFEGIKRKFTDIYMSIFKIERNYTKEEILEFYVNQPNLGAGAYGVQQAALTYFGKDAKDLNLTESALIAGLFQAPSAYNPFNNPESAAKRRSTVLYLMQRHGYITKEERELADSIPVETLLNTKVASNEFQGFIDTVVEEIILLTKQDPYVVPMEVYTTMDREKQVIVNNVMNGVTYTWENDVVDAGIAVINVKDGSIAAIGAGRHRPGQRQFNNATMIKRQIGSTAKPIYDYGPGFEFNNWSTYEQFVDEPHSYTRGPQIKNVDGKFQGIMTLRTALVLSRNIPALKAFQSNQNSNIREFALSLGMSPEIEGNAVHEAHALGGYNGESPVSMAAAYGAFGNGGYYTKPYSFTKIIYKETKEEFLQNPIRNNVMSDATAYMITDILVDSGKRSLGSRYKANGGVFGAKSGTTNFTSDIMKKFKFPSNAVNDRWMSGMSSDYGISVWYGYPKINADYVTRLTNNEHSKVFAKVAEGVYSSKSQIVQPKSVVRVAVEKETWPAMLPSANTPSDMIVTELFKVGTEPTEVSPRYAQLESPTNLTQVTLGNKVTLSWEPIETPNAVNLETYNAYLDSLYNTTQYRDAAYNARIEYNTNFIGEIGYNIYKQNIDDSLSLIGFTRNSNFEYTMTDTATFVVKSAYSIFKASESNGINITVPFSSSEIQASLVGDSTQVIARNGTYIEQGIKVTEGGVDVTSNLNPGNGLTITIKNEGGTVSSIDTSKSGSYTIDYAINYKNFSKTLRRTIIIL
jgi:penicillin-binding protein 1A